MLTDYAVLLHAENADTGLFAEIYVFSEGHAYTHRDKPVALAKVVLKYSVDNFFQYLPVSLFRRCDLPVQGLAE